MTSEHDSRTGQGTRLGRRNWLRCLALVLVLLPLACHVPARAASASGARRITVIFRFDDYARSCSSIETELLKVFQEHKIPCTYGVIPYVSDTFTDDPANCLAIDRETAGGLTGAVRSGLVEIALHGFAHRDNAIAPKNPGSESEFRGLSYSSQHRMLSVGKATLESLYRVRVTTFIPPWNSYDQNTLRALEDLGFEVVSSSGLTFGIADSGRFKKLRFLPYTCMPGHLREAVEFARISSDPDPIIVVLLHPFNFVEYDRDRGQFTCQSFDDLLSWLAAQPDVGTQTLGGAAKMARDLSYQRLLAFSARRGMRQGNEPAFFTANNAEFFFYHSTPHAFRTRTTSRGRLILFYFLLAAVTAVLFGLAASLAFSSHLPGSVRRIARYVTAGLLGLYIIYVSISALANRAIRHWHWLVLSVMLGLCIGTWAAASVAGLRGSRRREPLQR
jgi:peptidoglycan/xylan/chitin deacetylase (PgdA/CDA1 family)